MSTTRAPADVRLRTNVQCIRLWTDGSSEDELTRSFEELRPRLTYFELIALRERNRYLFPSCWTEHAELTAEQRQHRDAFLRDFREPPWEPTLDGFRPFYLMAQTEPVDTPPSEPAPSPARAALKTQSPGPGPFETPPLQPAVVHPERQSDIINAPLQQSMLVLAPPGTGKTHVLIQRIATVLLDGRISDPAHEMLVLSFTRATVAEVRKRLAAKIGTEASDDLRYVSVTTFDAFATRVLAQCGREDLLSSSAIRQGESSFDARIRSLADLLEFPAGVEAVREIIGRLKYLFVDEIQDLVGPRARLVLRLIRIVLGGGGAVLVLGDPAQAIYDYQDATPDSRKFLEGLRELVLTQGRELHLKEFFRFADPAMNRFVISLCEAVGTDGSSPDGEALRRLLYKSGSPVGFNMVPSYISSEGAAAILTRNNAEAHQIVTWLRKNEIPCEHHRGAAGGTWPPEIAMVFLGWKQERISWDALDRRVARLSTEPAGSSVMAVRELLIECGAADDDGVDLLRLRQILGTERPPQMQLQTPGIIVSTVHRSKGLEYERVLLLEPDAQPQDSAKPEELRILYVAATRARREIRLLTREPGIIRRARLVGRTGYWVEGGRVYLNGAGDLDPDVLDPTLRRSMPVRKLLKRLWDVYGVSDSKSEPLFICIRRDKGREHFTVAMKWEGRFQEICRCGGKLSQALWGRSGDLQDLGEGERGWCVRVQGLETVTLAIETGTAAQEMGKAGVVLLPVLESPIKTRANS